MVGTSGLPLAGVEAIVEGLSSFQGDVRQMNSALDSIRPRGTLLQNIFSSAWETVKNFGREVLNVAEYALGHILGDTVEWVIGKIGELISATIDAGSEFQTLELRLERLNFNSLIESGTEFNAAQKLAIELTKSQLEWLQKLAATTPYDNTDISNVYTLARSYGFADDAARGLTEDIVNFASGMGLGNTEIERIIVNFGQMTQQGKVTQREMTDLARGAFVPVNDILKRMQKNLGLSSDELTEFRKTAASVPEFMKAFSQIVDERFSGSAERMAKTFKAASDNAQDVVKSIGGLRVVKPILDVIGERVAAFVSAFTDNPERWNRLVDAASHLGAALSSVISGILGLLPSTESVADSVVSAVERIANWVDTHRADIIGFFQGIGDTVRDKIIPWVQDHLVPLFDRISGWVTENGPTINEFFSTVGQIIADLFKSITNQPGKQGGGGDILDSITEFMKFVIENKEEIEKWVKILWSVFVVWQVLSTIWNIAIGIVISLAGFILGLVSAFSGLYAILGVVIPIISSLLIPLALVVGAVALVILWFKALKIVFGESVAAWTAAIAAIKIGQDQLKANFLNMINNIKTAFTNGNWIGIGKAIVDGIANGVKTYASTIITAAKNAAMAAYNAAKAALGISSPSKLFMQIGQFTMEGFAQGIENAAGLAVEAMQSAVGAVAMPAISSMAAAQGNTSTTNNNLSLTVNSSAPSENIIQDFNMLGSLVGA